MWPQKLGQDRMGGRGRGAPALIPAGVDGVAQGHCGGRGCRKATRGGHVAERWLHHTAATQDSAGQGLYTWAWRPCSHPQEARCGWDSAGEQWAACGLSTRSPLDPGRALGACKGRRTRTAGQMLTSSGEHMGTSAAGAGLGGGLGTKAASTGFRGPVRPGALSPRGERVEPVRITGWKQPAPGGAGRADA